ncbi:MAG: glycosyltransferase [Muribaculaceae bacterium]|nr:glycosyltransferase [Muribaculaceae bacterium]
MVPLFAIITATYNAQDTIERTLESVDSQTCKDYEHLIVDGASKDRTLDILESHCNPQRTVISERDNGLYDAMNKGIASTNGRYLIFLNAGDKFHSPDTLEKIRDAIIRSKFPGIVYGQTLIVDNNGNPLGPRHLTAPDKLTLQSFSKGMLVCHQAFIPLRHISGFYRTEYRFSADFEWCIRCLQHSRKNVGLTDTYLVDYLNEGLTTRNKIPSLIERFKIMSTYYGFFTTTANHLSFVVRCIRRRLNRPKAKK